MDYSKLLKLIFHEIVWRLSKNLRFYIGMICNDSKFQMKMVLYGYMR